MRLLICPICGGKLNIKIGTEYAICDSCGSLTKIDSKEAERFKEIYQSAERTMRLNSVEGYEEALRQLDSISFIEEARKKAIECKARLHDLQADLQRRQAASSSPGQQNTGFAGVLLAVTLIFCAAALVGAVWLAVQLIHGALSPRVTTVVIVVTVLAIILFVFNKLKRTY